MVQLVKENNPDISFKQKMRLMNRVLRIKKNILWHSMDMIHGVKLLILQLKPIILYAVLKAYCKYRKFDR